jgi:signal transduction histidine kinase
MEKARDDGSRDESGASPSDVSFPDAPRLQLDQLLGELTERAHEVMTAQGRLRGLLRANAAVVAELSLPAVLRRIVTSACELLQARYGALGVIGPDGQLEQFLHVGMDEDVVERIGHLPQGKGLLGALIQDPRPIRLSRISHDPRSVGFPPGHPAMESFLGVPIRVRGVVFGNLYLTERDGGSQFTEEDEQLAAALAGTAGVAIENARLYEESERRRRWLASSTEVTRALLSADGSEPLEMIAQRAAEDADAVVAMLLLPLGEDRLTVDVATGPLAEQLVGKVVPCDDSLAGEAIRTGRPILSTHPGRLLLGVHPAATPIGPLIAVPLDAGSAIIGALCVARTADSPLFTSADVDMVAGFANHAALAMELARGRADEQLLRTVEDHDRIAGDLHDHVIQQLFAVGMTLHSVAAGLSDPRQAARLAAQVETLDATIAQIRTSIYELHQPQGAATPLRGRLVEIATTAADALGFEPGLRLKGPIDSLPRTLADDVAAVTREALSNCARHARATLVDVAVTATSSAVTIEVADDGCGIGVPQRSSGLSNMRRRAEAHHGTLGLGPRASRDRQETGTLLVWTAQRARDPDD